MRFLKKGMAFILVLIMIMSVFPASFAEEGASASEIVSEEIIYNLGNMEITVGNDADKLADEDLEGLYNPFEADGSYTIELEENAFFPYEVQFKGESGVKNIWFDTPDSTVEFEGHTFRVHTIQNDPNQLSQAGVNIGGTYVPIKPEEKEFTNDGEASTYTLLPIEEFTGTLDLSGYIEPELINVKLEAVLSSVTPNGTAINIKDTDKIVWSSGGDDDFKPLTGETVLDLTRNDNRRFELIVGSALQLDSGNKRYIIEVNATYESDWLSVELNEDVNGSRRSMEVDNISSRSSSDGVPTIYVDAINTDPNANGNTYISLSFKDKSEQRDMKVYTGIYKTVDELNEAKKNNESVDITSQIYNVNISDSGGYPIFDRAVDNRWRYSYSLRSGEFPTFNITKKFTLELIKGENTIIYPVNLMVEKETISSLTYDNGAMSDILSNNTKSNEYRLNCISTNDTIVTNYMNNGVLIDAEYRFHIGYRRGTQSNVGGIRYAVVGRYTSITEVEDIVRYDSSKDIKNDLFGDGYRANYSGNGVDFTIVDNYNGIFYIKVVAVEGDRTSETTTPSYDYRDQPGKADAYMQITGAEGLNNSNMYLMPYEHDSYYYNGYQTVFVNNSEFDLTKVKPEFRSGSDLGVKNTTVYAKDGSGRQSVQTSRENQLDFSQGAVQYTVTGAVKNWLNPESQTGQSGQCNYWVTFVKKQTGAKLFVNGANVKDSEGKIKREVLLNSGYGNKHDVFIANIGDEQLTGLNAEIKDAQNIKLDDYWLVGGDGNNTLAAFTSVDKTKSNGELDNVAKVRLVPTDEITGSGDISGTLVISTANGDSVSIELSGKAGDPKIITDNIPEAVKYVPYSAIIQNNNMYKWNTVNYYMMSGNLPEGVTLLENGEIYGVPKEIGEFTFTVRMNNEGSGFNNSYDTKTFTLTVKENTDENVNAETDAADGYDITTRVGVNDEIEIESVNDQLFEISGDGVDDETFDEFVDFWLDGEKLTKDVDYILDEGSTKITVRAQTFKNKGTGKHTIAAEFRNKEKKLKKSAQNYNAKNRQNGGGSVGGGGGGGGSSKPVTKPEPEPTPTPEPAPTPEPQP